MFLKGRVWKDDSMWLIECPALQAMTQGHTKKEALEMLIDWVRSILEKDDFPLEITSKGEDVMLKVQDPKPILALMVERNRNAQGLTLREIADRLGVKGRAGVKQYETGKHDPGFTKAQELFEALGYEMQIELIPKNKRA